MILQITKECAIKYSSVQSWKYDKDTDTTTFFLPSKRVLSAKGNWGKYILDGILCGAIWTDGKNIKQRK